MADRDAYLTDPEFRDVPVDRLLDPGLRGRACRRGSTRPRRGAAGRDRTRTAAARSTSRRSTARATRSASSSRTTSGFGSGVVDPETGIHYQNRGAYFSLDPDHPNVLAPGQADAPHAAPGDALPDRRAAAVGRDRAMGGDAQPQIHAQVVSAFVDGGVDVATAVAAPRWFVEPARPLRATDRRPRGAALRAGRPRGARGEGPPGRADGAVRRQPRPRARDRAGRRRPARGGGSVAAATDPRSAGCRPSGEARDRRWRALAPALSANSGAGPRPAPLA